MADNKGLPVHGYTSQSDRNVALANRNKVLEEIILRRIDELAKEPGIDQRNLAIARTHTEGAFMRMNRAIFQPKRLEGDLEHYLDG